MPSLIAYRKAFDPIKTHELRLPMPASGERAGQELCTLEDGRTIVVVFDGHTIPADQPAQIAASIEALPAPLSESLRAQIRAASPHCRLISSRVRERIRARYTAEDEMELNRIGNAHHLGVEIASEADIAAFEAYHLFVKAQLEWAAAERAKLGV